jgi:hypothetical protein
MSDEQKLLLGAKFDQICELIWEKVGYGELKELSADERQQVVEEAEELIENWDLAVFEDWDLEPKGRLQKLLSEYREISEQIILDLWGTSD